MPAESIGELSSAIVGKLRTRQMFLDGAKSAHSLWIYWLMDGVKAMEIGNIEWSDHCFHEAEKARERGWDYEMRAGWLVTEGE